MAKAPQTPPRDPDDAVAPEAPAVAVDVARTGGFAGMTRRWSAQPAGHEASEWITLIDRCPWEQAADPERSDAGAAGGARPPVADGFVWCIRASRPGTRTREAELPDDEVTGAWRDLVDAVRSWSGDARGHPGR